MQCGLGLQCCEASQDAPPGCATDCKRYASRPCNIPVIWETGPPENDIPVDLPRIKTSPRAQKPTNHGMVSQILQQAGLQKQGYRPPLPGQSRTRTRSAENGVSDGNTTTTAASEHDLENGTQSPRLFELTQKVLQDAQKDASPLANQDKRGSELSEQWEDDVEGGSGAEDGNNEDCEELQSGKKSDSPKTPSPKVLPKAAPKGGAKAKAKSKAKAKAKAKEAPRKSVMKSILSRVSGKGSQNGGAAAAGMARPTNSGVRFSLMATIRRFSAFGQDQGNAQWQDLEDEEDEEIELVQELAEGKDLSNADDTKMNDVVSQRMTKAGFGKKMKDTATGTFVRLSVWLPTEKSKTVQGAQDKMQRHKRRVADTFKTFQASEARFGS